ncbi:MAG: DUF2764 family protein [Candidatus Omnitrophica bacterium]|nr:DUF2764 family protein [Candidatus Omnitrophota bacterium]
MTNTPSYYTYLISSLPMLHFGRSAPFSFERFLEMCEDLVSETDINVIKAARNITESPYDNSYPTLGKWRAFDTALRNELVKIRAGRKHEDPIKYLRKDGYAEPTVSNIAMNAYKNPSILESERMLDEERWHFLEELTSGNFFNIDFLITYAHKLLLAAKWERINEAERPRLLEEAIWHQKESDA